MELIFIWKMIHFSLLILKTAGIFLTILYELLLPKFRKEILLKKINISRINSNFGIQYVTLVKEFV